MNGSSGTGLIGLSELIAGVNRRLDLAVEMRLKPAGVRIEQYRVLEALTRQDGQSMGELAPSVFVDLPTLTKIVDRMVANALVYRAPDPRDRRRVLVFLSERGREHFATLLPAVETERRQVIDGLSPSEASQLTALLAGLLDRKT
ncbi:MarR family transcriptional regulator [Jiella sp. MQZ9-1]|uniref:MarR family transcriptional regulator n=1 Tax=Jiella flava TaxID=2816857 RepID=A0A939JWP5_9HYPH|nr:MarR family transcriptional regulator [Jiella flava]MBO0662526.1 MarR family transcriptional regulator [Jiella flava]MCD2471751.1 MarR family transcriptional regulator [Jiella flava]